MTELVSTQRIVGIGPRLLSAADRLAPLAGTINGMIRPFFAKGGGSIGGAMSVAGGAVRSFNFASPLKTTMSALNQPNVYPVASGLGSWLGGLISREIGQELGGQVGSFLGTAGSAAQKFGVASAFMGILSAYFLEQRGSGLIGRGYEGVKGLTTGAGQNYRLAQDNPDIVPSTMARGVVTAKYGTEF
jgi:hypothetical protein